MCCTIFFELKPAAQFERAHKLFHMCQWKHLRILHCIAVLTMPPIWNSAQCMQPMWCKHILHWHTIHLFVYVTVFKTIIITLLAFWQSSIQNGLETCEFCFACEFGYFSPIAIEQLSSVAVVVAVWFSLE